MKVYAYQVDGIEYQTKSTAINREASEVGDECSIWYNPKKPKDAQPFHYESAKAYRIIFLIGIALVLLGLVLFVVGVASM